MKNWWRKLIGRGPCGHARSNYWFYAFKFKGQLIAGYWECHHTDKAGNRDCYRRVNQVEPF